MIIIFYSAKNPSLREERNGNDRNLPGKTWDVGTLRDKAVVALLTSILFFTMKILHWLVTVAQSRKVKV